MRHRAEITSFLVGAAAALVLIAGWRVPHGREAFGADVRISVARSSVVHVSRTGTVLDSTGLRPGEGARTTVRITNPTDRPLRLRPTAQVDDPALARLLRVEVTAGGDRLFSGPLASMNGNAALPLRLRPGAAAAVQIRLRLGRGDSAGRGTQAALVFSEAA